MPFTKGHTLWKHPNCKKTRYELWDIENGVTLCDVCHRKTPNYSTRAVKNPIDKTIYKVVASLLLIFGFTFPSVTEAATFGYTSAGTSNTNTDSVGIALISTLSEDGTVTSMSVHTEETSISSYVKMGIYAKSDDGLEIEGNDDVTSASNDWVTDDVTDTALTAADYWLVVVQQGTTRPRISYDSATAGTGGWDTDFGSTNDAFPATYTDDENITDREWSIYATYTADEGSEEAQTTIYGTVEGDVSFEGDVRVSPE